MQEWEDHVHLAEGARRLRRLGDHEVGGRAVGGEGDARSLAVHGRQLAGPTDAQPLGVAGLEDPAAVTGDADRDHVVHLAVDRRQHAPGRHAGDRVLAGPAAEDDGDAGLAGCPIGC
jgi:hypothetical protein